MIALVNSLITLCLTRIKRIIVVNLAIARVSKQISQKWTKVAPLYGNQDFRQEDQTFRGLKVIPSETGKVNGLEPLFFEKGSIQQNKMLKTIGPPGYPTFRGPR